MAASEDIRTLSADSVRIARPTTETFWLQAVIAAASWGLAAAITYFLPNVIPWGSTNLFAGIVVGGAVVLLLLSVSAHRLGAIGATLKHFGPWLVVLGLWFGSWELTTAKLGWLPKPFFSPPQGLLDVYIGDASRLLVCILYSLRLWAIGFGLGVAVGYALGVALGWSKAFSYWGMPVLKLIGPVPATAWIPCTFFFFPTTFDASVFIVALASGIPVAILTASGVGSVNRAFYDVGRILGAGNRYLVLKVAIPASLPHVFVGLFMGLYYSFAVLVVAEMLGAKYGLGWYVQFQSSYSAYANVYAALVIMAILCAGIVKLLFVARDRLLRWQKGFI
jgi:NitT/TauT family transport system permease protein